MRVECIELLVSTGREIDGVTLKDVFSKVPDDAFDIF